MGLDFNASQEQNQVAFTQFLGSAQAARRELGFLTKTAAQDAVRAAADHPAERACSRSASG
jgi:hypothetical protein